jgi:cysteine-rich repeat protein
LAFAVAGDEDTVAVVNDGTNPVQLTAETFGPGGVGTCVGIDTEINIRDAAGTELANDDEGGIASCFLETFIINLGEILFVHTVDFLDNTAVASYFLAIRFVELVCGDGVIVAGEGCDDGNTGIGDGCSDLCQVEPGFICDNTTPPSVCTAIDFEHEPNNDQATANDFVALDLDVDGEVFGDIGVAGDIDFYRITLAATGNITAETIDGAAGTTCVSNVLESQIQIFDAAGVELDFDDDGGAGFCSLATATAQPPGDYFIVVRASVQFGPNDIFDYGVRITVN